MSYAGVYIYSVHIVSTARCLERTKHSDVMTVAESDRHNACQESRGESVAPYMLLPVLTKHGKDQTAAVQAEHANNFTN